MLVLQKHNKRVGYLPGHNRLRLVFARPAVDKRWQEAGEAAAMACLNLIRLRLLNNLSCPPSVAMIETVIASFMLGRESGRLGLEGLAELMGHSGSPEAARKFAQRSLDVSSAWQKRANVETYKVTRGKRNVRRVTEFRSNRLNDAAIWVSQQVNNDARRLPLITKIDQYTEPAVSKFLRGPLAAVQRPPQPKKHSQKQGRSITSRDISLPVSTVAQPALRLAQNGFRMFPVESKTPRI
jgi:hypothetical protein